MIFSNAREAVILVLQILVVEFAILPWIVYAVNSIVRHYFDAKKRYVSDLAAALGKTFEVMGSDIQKLIDSKAKEVQNAEKQ